jgi:hypothetical protein
MQRQAADAERILEILIRARAEAIQRQRKTTNAQF